MAANFMMDDKTVETLHRLKGELNAPSTAEVLRRAITLLSVATELADGKDSAVELRGETRARKLLLGV